mgnify:CR=1 FL=1
MIGRIYISDENDPYFNVSSEHALFLKSTETTQLYLWQNSSCIVCGRNQNVHAECNMEFLKKNNILPVRRFSGGGAVYHDLGNLNFTFITREKNADVDKYLRVIKKAMHSINVHCEFSGRNDLLTDGKKFSGHAYYSDEGNYLYHGTIMVDVDMETLTQALNPSKLKMKSKGIDSVRSRVVNLRQIREDITIDTVKNAMIQAFQEIFHGEYNLEHINKDNFTPPLYEKIQSDEWIFGESPEFSLGVERKLAQGNVAISVDVLDGKINHMTIQTDSLEPYDFADCINGLIGTFYDEDLVFEHVENFMMQ